MCSDKGVSVVVQAANMLSAPCAIEVLRSATVAFAPRKACDAGGPANGGSGKALPSQRASPGAFHRWPRRLLPTPAASAAMGRCLLPVWLRTVGDASLATATAGRSATAVSWRMLGRWVSHVMYQPLG